MFNMICVFSIFLHLTGYESRHIQPTEECLTAGCQEAALTIKNNMNPYADPCEDFYEFACGGFRENIDLGSFQLGINSFSMIREATFQQLKELLSEDLNDDEILPFRMSKQFYADCLDERKILSFGLSPIFQKVDELGGWPVVTSDWSNDHFSWIDVIKKSRKIGFPSNFMLSMDVETYLLNSTYRIIYVSPPQLSLPAYNLKRGISDARVGIYFKLMLSLALRFKIPFEKAIFDLGSSLDFEISLAKILPTVMDRKDDLSKTFKAMTIAEAQKNYPFIDWLEFLKAMLLHEGDNITEETVFVLAFPEFVKNLKLIMDQTSDRTIANYLIWRVIFFSMNSYLMLSEQPRWKSCIAMTADRMNVPVAAMYVRRYFHEKSKLKILEISNNIRNQMKKTLMNSTWIDDITRENAIAKIDRLTTNVAFPEILLDDTAIVNLFQNTRIKPGHYYESFLEMMRFDLNITTSTLHDPVNRQHWMSFENPLVINAFYSLPENSMKIPAALLQRNIYKHDVPNYLNYGAIGFIISHELSHAFDDQGSTFDKNGNFKNWWNSKTKEEYMKRVQCFVDQYSKYRLKETGDYVNGVVTQGENIADNEGARQAYNAYRSWALENEPELKLPGLNYTPTQLFWISAANVWCSKYSSTYLEIAISEDLHAPDRYRIIGTLSNQKQFAEDFFCKKNTPMNPTNKCSLWV